MHERIISLYEENAAAWDRQRGRDLHERDWLERFAALLPEGGRVLDIGCGMGEPIARWLIGRGFSVTGVDSAPAMIALCEERFPKSSWQVADMRELALGERFDGLIAWHSLFHLRPEDQPPMFARFADHSAPGAALMFTSGPERGESIGEWRGEPLYHGSLDPAEYRRLLAGNGFAVVEYRQHDPDCGRSNVWLARHR
jgi:2-polyprenyl-3-methyl-5-hydroxy-6-metoxy-1,4-benzoquinol methylase